ncbi:uncharacterized protein LOC121387882 [Gigantopelta aegis]|uniref:uncharacterized protein LOC121387882 n=1 Tax=Gigantopelta aegis TaxID=1735272 RepID=UPI001B88C5D4|nr:uncharacterized protein LOC121387882 [Gigantopelta aegis]
MADRRRRRRREDEAEDDETEKIVTVDGKTSTVRRSECESEDEGVTPDGKTEPKTGTEESKTKDAADNEEEEEEESEEDSEEEETDEDDDDDDDDEEEGEEEYDVDVIIEDDASWVEEERQSGDGEEQKDQQKELDDDEDRKNPAFIPRKGAFYEHDTRMGAQEKEMEEQGTKKMLWKENDRWIHDRFQQDEQAPKSRDELIALYGYDIRAGDKPPDRGPSFRGQGRRGRRPYRRSELGDFVDKNSRNYSYNNKNQPQEITETDYRPTQKYRSYDNKPSDYRLQNQDNDDHEDQRSVGSKTFDVRSQFDRFQQQRNLVDKVAKGSHSDSRVNQSDSKVNQSDSRVNQSDSRADHTDSRADHSDSRADHSDSRARHSDSLSQDVRNQDFRENQSEPRDTGYQNRQNARIGPRNQSENQDYRKESNWRAPYKNQYDRELRNQPDRRDIQRTNYQSEYTDRRNDDYRGRGRNARRGRGGSSRAEIAPRYNRMQNAASVQSYTSSEAPQHEFINSTYQNTDEEKQVATDTEVHETSESQDVIISNKDRMISVTITNTTTEKKYMKERHGKYIGVTRSQDSVDIGMAKIGGGDGIEKKTASNVQGPPEAPVERKTIPALSVVAKTESGQQIRPKRYSSQRQRTAPDSAYTENIPAESGSTYYNPGTAYPPSPAFHPERVPPVTGQVFQHPERAPPAPAPVFQHPPDRVPPSPATVFQHSPERVPPAPPVYHPDRVPVSAPEGAFQATILQPPLAFTLPVSTPGLSSPPRIFPPNVRAPVSIAAPTRLIAPQYLTGGMVYGSPPPPPGQYQMPVAFPSPPTGPPPPAPAPVQTTTVQGPRSSGPPGSAGPELYRGGTTYYAPELQRASRRRSPTRRPKLAIPIVKPEVTGVMFLKDRPRGSKNEEEAQLKDSEEGGQQEWNQYGEEIAHGGGRVDSGGGGDSESQPEYIVDDMAEQHGWTLDSEDQHDTSSDSITTSLPNMAGDTLATSGNIGFTTPDSTLTCSDTRTCDTARLVENSSNSAVRLDSNNSCAAGAESGHKEGGDDVKSDTTKSKAIEVDDLTGRNDLGSDGSSRRLNDDEIQVHSTSSMNESGNEVEKTNISDQVSSLESPNVCGSSVSDGPLDTVVVSEERKVGDNNVKEENRIGNSTQSSTMDHSDIQTETTENDVVKSVCHPAVQQELENNDGTGIESDMSPDQQTENVSSDLLSSHREEKQNSCVSQTDTTSANSIDNEQQPQEVCQRNITCDEQGDITSQRDITCEIISKENDISNPKKVICVKQEEVTCTNQGEVTCSDQGEVKSRLCSNVKEEQNHRAPVVHEFVVKRQLKVEDCKPSVREFEMPSASEIKTTPSFAIEQQTSTKNKLISAENIKIENVSSQ